MYRQQLKAFNGIKRNTSTEGETIEQKIFRLINNKEPLTDKVDLIYTERREGVRAETDIRTDKWELAAHLMSTASNSKREARTKGQTALEDKYRDWETDRKSTRLNSSHITRSRMPSSA